MWQSTASAPGMPAKGTRWIDEKMEMEKYKWCMQEDRERDKREAEREAEIRWKDSQKKYIIT